MVKIGDNYGIKKKISAYLDYFSVCFFLNYNESIINQRTKGPVNAHLISWPSKA